MKKTSIYIGTAAWALPSAAKHLFSGEGTHLKRYAGTFNCVEINSSFYREHKAETYEKWSRSVPKNFRFSVKLYRKFTHQDRLVVNEEELSQSLFKILHLKDTLGPLLVQLPPSLSYEEKIASDFFSKLRKHYEEKVIFEPRHQTWKNAGKILSEYKIAKVKADPEPCPFLTEIKQEIQYYRLHGSPDIYSSSYSTEYLANLAKTLRENTEPEQWCIFDNTMHAHATFNALELMSFLSNTDSSHFKKQKGLISQSLS